MGALNWGDVFFDIEANRDGRRSCTARRSPASCTDPATAASLVPEPSVRLQAPDHRPGLLRDVQPRQRHPGRPAQGPDPRGDARPASQTERGSYELDVIIYATGFDAMTGALSRIDIRGRDGVSPAATSGPAEGPVSYLGLQVAGIPEPVHRPGAGQPVGSDQLRRRTGAARGMDRRVHRAPARPPGTGPSRRCRPRSPSGSSTPRRWSHRRCWSTRRATPGTTAATFRARSGCTWATSPASPNTGAAATRSPPPATPASRSGSDGEPMMRSGRARHIAVGLGGVLPRSVAALQRVGRLAGGVAARAAPTRRGGAGRTGADRDDIDRTRRRSYRAR